MDKILIVEDSKSYSNMIRLLLENKGFEVSQVFTLNEAKDDLLVSTYDYILLDLVLPDGEGSDLISNLSNFTNNQKTKFIILSGEHDIQKRNYLFEHGIIEYFSKNVNVRELTNQIARLIDSLKLNIDKNILIIDDSSFVRNSMKDMLNTKNYNVVLHSNAIDALKYLEMNAHEIDLVFCDIEMPNMNGIEFLSKVKRNPKTFNVPLIILSSSSDREIYARSLRNGAVDFLKKPFLIEEILLKTDLHIRQSDANKKIMNQAKELQEYKKVLNASDIVSKTDAKGIITFANDKFCEISGYSRDELLGKHYNIVRHPDVPKSVFEDMWKTIHNKETFKGIVKNKRKMMKPIM